MEINKRCFKIDKPNALAMIAGLSENGGIRYQSIWVDVVKKPFPMLITLNRSSTRFKLSDFGNNLNSEQFIMTLKYVADLDSEFFIKNDIKLWEKLCSNGLFNIWDPMSPYKRLDQSKSNPSDFRIQLLRVYEIYEEFNEEDVIAVSSRIDHLATNNLNVTIKNPIIADEEFKNIKKLLVDSLREFKSSDPPKLKDSKKKSLKSLAALSDRKAVLSAINEFNQVGRDAFLKRYGFGPAREYFIVHNGQYYDSKAIAGASVGYQYPDSDSLRAEDFSGGEATVVKQLHKLGFKIERITKKQQPKQYWAFAANPNIYRIRDAITSLEVDHWTIGKSDVRIGDRAIIWQTLDKEGKRGVVGLGQVVENPIIMSDSNNPFWVKPDDAKEEKPRIAVRYISAPNLPIWIGQSNQVEFLDDLSVARSRGGTVFRLSEEQWHLIIKAAGDLNEVSEEEIEAIDRIRSKTKQRSGQGFGLSSVERKIVEMHAMSKAEQYFKHKWETVQDVSANTSFDLLCKSDENELHVEVKGTTTLGTDIVLTKNEVLESQRADYALFLVSEIELDRSEPNSPLASGGRCTLFQPWREQNHILKPLAYSCQLNLKDGTEVVIFDEKKI